MAIKIKRSICRLARLSAKLIEFNSKVQCIAGSKNLKGDFLSRPPVIVDTAGSC